MMTILNYKKRFFILFCVVVFFVCSINVRVLAVTDTSDDIEAGSNGAIDNQNIGSNWSEYWGVSYNCVANVLVSDSNPLTGLKSIKTTVAGDNACGRNFPVRNNDNDIFSFSLKQSVNNSRFFVGLYSDTAGDNAVVYFYMGSDGYFKVYNNTTLTSIASYSINTKYDVQIQTKFSTEEFRVKIDDGEWSSWYHTYDYLNSVDNQYQKLIFNTELDGIVKTAWLDDLLFQEQGEEPPVGGEVSGFASSTQDMLYALEWQYMIFWEVVFFGVGTLFTVGVIKKFI